MQVYTPSDEFFSGYAGESPEGLAYIDSVAVSMPFSLGDVASQIPDEVDVRLDPKFLKEWMRTENQGGVGACQGYGLVETVEYCFGHLTGSIVQLAPLFAYLMSQKFDGISGDRGSTLAGGTRVLKEIGLPELSDYPLERQYPRGGYKAIPQSAVDAAKAGSYKTLETVRIRDAESLKAFIGSMAGIVQTGTRWTKGLADVAGHGVVTTLGGLNYGGHSWNLCGYKPIDQLGAEARRFVPRTKYDWIAIGKNSHSTRYGEDGFMYLIPEFVTDLARHDQLLGRTDMGDIKPRPSAFDFTRKEHSRFSA